MDKWLVAPRPNLRKGPMPAVTDCPAFATPVDIRATRIRAAARTHAIELPGAAAQGGPPRCPRRVLSDTGPHTTASAR